jgi:hypothetical protein
MAMFALSHATLRVSARSGENHAISGRYTSRVRPKHMNRLGELGINHGGKPLKDRENLAREVIK